MSSGSTWTESFIRDLADKDLRNAFVADQVKTRLGLAIRALREQDGRALSQQELGRRMNKPQSTVSRIEDPDYGRHSLQTVLDAAAALDVPVSVTFPEWEDWLREIRTNEDSSFHRASFDADRIIADKNCAPETSSGADRLFLMIPRPSYGSKGHAGFYR